MKSKYFLLFLILLLHLLAWFALKPVWPTSDDYFYTVKAESIFSGASISELQYRCGVFVPASILLKVFGETDYTIALWPLIASLLTITIVYLFTSKYAGNTIGAIASGLIAINILQVMYSITLFPDLIVAFYSTALMLVLFHSRAKKDTSYTYPIFLNALFIIGFLTKETIVLVIPFLLFVMGRDMVRKENTLFWKRTLLFSGVAIIFLLTFYYIVAGSPFQRLRSIHEFATKEIDYSKARAELTAMWNPNFFLWLNGEAGYIFMLLFSLPAIYTLRKTDLNDFKHFTALFFLFLFVELAVLFHIPTYGILFMQERQWMIIIAPLSILAAYFIVDWAGKEIMAVFVVALLLLPVNYFSIGHKRTLLLGLFCLMLSACEYLRIRRNWKIPLLILPFVVLFIYFLLMNSNYLNQTE
jgi:4-amino-4-deoxy-L-arabinose transferase-like glycosyltransferase